MILKIEDLLCARNLNMSNCILSMSGAVLDLLVKMDMIFAVDVSGSDVSWISSVGVWFNQNERGFESVDEAKDSLYLL